MRKFLALLLFFAALPALADTWAVDTNVPQAPGDSTIAMAAGGAYIWTYTAGDTTGDKTAIQTSRCDRLSFTSEFTSGTAEMYGVPTASTATSSGTALFTPGSSQRTSTTRDIGSTYLRPRVATTGSGSIRVRCFAIAPTLSSLGATPDITTVVSSQNASYDVTSNLSIGLSRFATGELRVYANRCLQMQEAVNPNLVSVTLGSSALPEDDWSVRFAGSASIAWSDFYDPGPYRFCLGFINATNTLANGGEGGFTVSNSGYPQGWPSITQKLGKVSRPAAGASTATNVLTDAAGAFDSSYNTRYVEITSSTGGCTGNKRYITGQTATTLTVDTNFSASCTNVGYKVWEIPIYMTDIVSGLRIFWDAVRLDVDQTGQTKVGVVFQYGNYWATGNTAATSPEDSNSGLNRGSESGSLLVRITGTDAASTGWVNGRIADWSATGLVTADRAMIVQFVQGQLRFNDTTFRNYVGGSTASPVSQDNIGFWSTIAWGTDRFGGLRAERFGTAAQFFGNNAGKFYNWYPRGNYLGLVWGSHAQAGNTLPWSSCTTGYCTMQTDPKHGPSFDHPVLESDDYGLLVTIEAGIDATITDPYFESGTVSRTQIALGAGVCSAANATSVGTPCIADRDCNFAGGAGGVCQATGLFGGNYFQFSGGQLGSVVSTNNPWRALSLGPNANNNFHSFVFDGGVALPVSYINSNVTGANTFNCTGAGAPHFYCTGANANPAVELVGVVVPPAGASTQVKYLGVRGGTTGNVQYPYDYLSSSESILLQGYIADTQTTNNPTPGNAVMALTNNANAGANADTFAPTVNNLFRWGQPLGTFGAGGQPGWYLQELACECGDYTDAGEANESSTWNVVVGDSAGLSVAAGTNSIQCLEGTSAPGLVQRTNLGINTKLFACSTGTCVSGKDNVAAGVMLTAKTDATNNNAIRVRCAIKAFPVPLKVGN